MKALILCGGKGTRLRPITYTRAKQLVPIANKLIVAYGIESVVRAGIRDIGIVVGDTGSEFKRKLGDGSRWGADFTYIRQARPLGIAHAVKQGRDFLQDEPFVMYLGDNLIKHEVADLIGQFERENLDALIQLKAVDDPRRFGVAELDDEGRVIHLEEKPERPRSDLALVGVYVFSHKVHGAIETLQPSARGEYEITDAIWKLLDTGARVGSNVITEWWLDTGKKDDMLEANQVLLDELSEQRIAADVAVDSSSRVTGRVHIAGGTQVENCIIRGPAVIGARCRLHDAYVGPYTAIGKGVEIVGSEIEQSIILDGGRVLNLGSRIADAIIGCNSEIVRVDAKPAAYRFMLGDDSKVEII